MILLVEIINSHLEMKNNQFRGYNKLIMNKPQLANVRGILLADNECGFHPCVTKEVIDELNKNDKSDRMMYYVAQYDPTQIIA